MKCPSCRADVADDAAICPNCDHILDPSLFDAEPPRGDADEVTGKKKLPSKPVSKAGAKKVVGKKKPVVQQRAGGMRMPEAPAAKPKREPTADWRQKVSKEDWDAGGPKKSMVSEPNIKPLDVEDFMSDTKHFIFDLSIPDKLALFGSIGMAISCAFPWKETVQDGEVLGLLSRGVLVFALGIVSIAAITVRARSLLGNLSPVVPWVLQLGTVAGGLLWAVIYATSSIDRTLARAPVGNEEVWVSKPAFGVFLAIVCGGVAALGTIFGLKGKD